MTIEALEQQTYLPEETDQLAPVLSFLDAHRARGERVSPRYLLVGSEEGDQVTVPASVHRVLVQVVEALSAGRAVTVAPHSLVLTTQQAADLLGVSRPTIVRLIDSGELAADRVGNRRKVMLRDALAYRDERRQRQYEAIMATSVDIDDEDDPAEVLQRLREIREARRQTVSHKG